MALLSASPGRKMNIVVLNKALFYLDLTWLRDHGHTATDQTYVALEQGPVVAKYDKRLVRELVTRGLAEQLSEGMAKPVHALADVSESVDPELRDLAREVARAMTRETSASASDLSHENPGWIAAWKGPGHPPQLIDMELALQQVMDDDPWLDEPADAALKEAFRSCTTNTVRI